MKIRIPLLVGILALLALFLWKGGHGPGTSNAPESPAKTARAESATSSVADAATEQKHADRAEDGAPEIEDPLARMLHLGQLLHAADEVMPLAGTAEGKRRVEIYRTTFRYPMIRVERAADGQIVEAMVADHLLVRRAPDVSHEAFAASLKDAGLEIRRRLFGDSGYLVTVSGDVLPGTLEEIAAKLGPSAAVVRHWEADPIATISTVPNDPSFSKLTGMSNPADADIDATEAWDISTDASSVVVGVIDTGIDTAHPDLAANIWTNPDEIAGNNADDDGNGLVDDVHGYDFYNDDAVPADDNQHGTHCAGTIGAIGNNGIGVAGVTWSVKMMALKSFGEEGTGAGSGILEAIVYASEMGARVTSNSYTSSSSSVARNEAIEAAGEAGCLHVAAAGNSSRNLTPEGEPGWHSYVSSACLDHVISVAATDSSDKLASFSNYGNTVVHLAAPGVNIFSTLPGNAYGALSGTSMATPHVAGACALLLGQRPELSSLQVKQQALAAVDLVPSLAEKTITGGRLNVRRMISGLSTEPPVITSATTVTATFGETFSYQIVATNFASDFGATGLPFGLTINRDTGVISGLLVETGEFSVVLRASNLAGSATANLTLTVGLAPPVITSPATAGGALYAAFTHTVVATGGLAEFSASGLPAGLNINATSGVISGNPLVQGEFEVSITATNGLGSVSQTLHLTIGAASAPVFLSVANQSAVVGSAWSLALEADSLPTRYGATGLPDGLSINTATGLISGTPTAVGSHVIHVEAENPAGIGHAQFTLAVNPESAPVLSVPSTVSMPVGQPFSFTITASQNPTSFGTSGLPIGLTLGAGGVISGTPTVPGQRRVTLSASNATGTGMASVWFRVLPEPPVITSATSASFTAGDPFLYEITATGTVSSVAATNLPEGLTLLPGTKKIAGTVSEAGIYPINLSASNAGGTGTAVLTLTVLPRIPVITSNLEAYVGKTSPFTYQITVDHGPASFSTSALPAGLSLNPNTGLITGSVATVGVYPITLSATNNGGTGTAVLQLTVHQGETRITSFSPTQVLPESFINIDGVGFTGATHVYFSDRMRDLVPASSFTVMNDGRIRAKVPYLRQAYEFDYSWIIVISPRGLAVTMPPSTIEVSSGYDLGGSGGQYALVHAGGALVSGGGGRQRVVVENGGSASMEGGGGGHTYFVDGGGFLDMTGGHASNIFRSPGAILLNEASVDSIAEIREVSSVRATIVPSLLRVIQIPQFDSPATASGVIGQPFLYQIQTDGWAMDETYSLTGTLPPGLSFFAESGQISGYPQTAGVFDVTVQATNPYGTASLGLQITIGGPAIPVITSLTKVNGTPGSFLSYQITAANSPTSFGASGLPPGVSVNASTGVVSGMPSSTGVFAATLSATNASGTGTRSVTFVIGESPLAISSFSPQRVASGAPVNLTGRGFANVDRVYFLSRNWELRGDLGRTVNSDNSMSVVVPFLNHGFWDESPIIATTAERTTVTMPAGATRYNGNGNTDGSGGARIIVSPGATVTLGGGGGYLIYVESGGTVIASGGGGGHTIFLEDGATLNGSASCVVRSPSSILLNQSFGTSTLMPSLSLSMLASNKLLNVYEVPVITSGNVAGVVGELFAYPITVQKDEYDLNYVATGLPPGLSLNGDSGVIAGVPTTPGTYSVNLSVSGNYGTGTKQIQITIGPDVLPKLSSPSRFDGSVSIPVDVQLAATHGPVTYSATGLPAGFTLSSSGRLTGSTSQPGAWIANLTLTNANGSTAMKYVVTIGTPQPVIGTISPFTSVGQPTVISGTSLEQVTKMVFKENYVDLGVEGSSLSATATSVQSITPPLNNMYHRPGAVVSIFANGGVAVALPQTMEQISSSSGLWSGGMLARVRPGGVVSAYGSGSLFFYVESGGSLIINGGGGQVVYAEDGASVQILPNTHGIIIAAPNAKIVNPSGSEVTVTRVAGLRATVVPDYLKLSATPVITSSGKTRGYLNIPFYFPVQAINSPTNYAASGLPPGLSLHPTTGAISGAPTSAGNFTATLTTTNSVGNYSSSLSFKIGGPVDQWQEVQFASLPGGVEDPMAGDDSDADRDGIPNLLEYAAKLDPKACGTVKVASSKMVGGSLNFSFRRLKGSGTGSTATGYTVSGIRYTVESSGNATHWDTGASRFEQIGSPVDNGDGSETVTVRAIGAGRLLVRLKVERVALN